MAGPPIGHYSRLLAIGGGQMSPVFFDPMVLQRYASDPRYYFRYDDFGGMLGTADEYYLADDFPDEDKVLVDTFGMGWADDRPQAIAVYLVYLAKLSPRHQGLWHAFEIPDQNRFVLDRDYVRTSLYGEWPDRPSVVEAIFEEQRVLNDIAAAMGRPLLFKELFDAGDRPRGLQPFLLPTHEEMGRFILQFDQVLSENINSDFFAGEVERFEEQTMRDGRVQRITKGTIRLLKEWLELRYPERPELAAMATAGLAEVRDLRQGPAHRLTANDFDAAAWNERARLMGAVHAGLRAVRQELQQDPAAAKLEITSWLDDPVRTY